MDSQAEMDQVIGNQVRALRKRAGWTQARLIEQLEREGFKLPSVQALSVVENGKRSLLAWQLLAVSRALDVSMEQLTTPPEEDGQQLRNDLADALETLINALDAIYDATGALAKAQVPVTLDQLLRDRFDVAIRLGQAHPRTQPRFLAVAEDLIRHGLVDPEAELPKAQRRGDAKRVEDLKRQIAKLKAHEKALPEHLIPTEDEA